MVYAAFGEYLAAPIGLFAMEGYRLYLIGVIYAHWRRNDLSDCFLRPALYQLELAHHPIQYPASSCLALAALLGIALCVRIINMVSRHDR